MVPPQPWRRQPRDVTGGGGTLRHQFHGRGVQEDAAVAPYPTRDLRLRRHLIGNHDGLDVIARGRGDHFRVALQVHGARDEGGDLHPPRIDEVQRGAESIVVGAPADQLNLLAPDDVRFDRNGLSRARDAVAQKTCTDCTEFEGQFGEFHRSPGVDHDIGSPREPAFDFLERGGRRVDYFVRTQGRRHLQSLFDAVDQDHPPGSLQAGQLQEQLCVQAAAEDCDAVPLPDMNTARRMQTAGEGFSDRGFDHTGAIFDDVALRRKDDGVFGESSSLVAREWYPILTEVGHSVVAGRAAATRSIRAHCHPTADRQTLNSFAACCNGTRHFMSRDRWLPAFRQFVRARFMAAVIAATDPTASYLDEDLSGIRHGIGHGFNANVAGSESQRRFHLRL